jgi:predicted membrane protein
MTRTDLSETNWAPTRASTAVALLGTAGGVGALSGAVGVRKGVFVAGVGALCLAVALWLLAFDRWRVPATVAASLLLVPAGAGVTAGVGYETLVAFAASFPASSPTEVVAQTLRIVAVVAVLWGCTVAVFGAAASVRGVATAETLSRCLGLVNRVALAPLGFFLALSGHALVTNLDLGAASVVGELVSAATDWLLAPAAGRLHLLAFWVLFAAASYATYRAVRDLPLQELAGEATISGDSESGQGMAELRVADLVDSLQRGLGRLAAIAALLVPPLFLVEVAPWDAAIRNQLPDAVYGALVALTSSGLVRHLLVRVAVVAGALALIAALVRRSSRTSTEDVLVAYAPYLSGLAVVAGVGVVHRPVLDGLIEFVAGRLESPLSGVFREISGQVVAFYGSETIVLGLTAGVLALASVGVFALYICFALGFVSDRVAGPALAAGGLFLAAAFAATSNASLPLVLGSLVAALVVWDAGEFATTLGSEVGRRARTRRVELLHALGALSVGAVGAVAAGWVAQAAPFGAAAGGTTGGGATAGGELGGLSVALSVAVVAVVLLVAALR